LPFPPPFARTRGTLDADEQAAVERGLQNSEHARGLAPEIDAHRAASDLLSTQQAIVPAPSFKVRMNWTAGVLGVALAASVVFPLDLRSRVDLLAAKMCPSAPRCSHVPKRVSPNATRRPKRYWPGA